MKLASLLALVISGSAAIAQTPPAKKQPAVSPSLPPLPYALADALGGLTFSMPVAVVSPPGVTDRLFVLEKTGRIQEVTQLDQAMPRKREFASLIDRPDGTLDDKGECGLLGLAFHPEFARNGRYFVCYSLRIGGQLHQRVSRFDGQGEQPLITQRDPAGNHNGGDLHFGPDGYLYISVGDGGGANDVFDNARFINKDFHAAILRIDVDKKLGSLPPNPHPAVHAGTYTVRRTIPLPVPPRITARRSILRRCARRSGPPVCAMSGVSALIRRRDGSLPVMWARISMRRSISSSKGVITAGAIAKGCMRLISDPGRTCRRRTSNPSTRSLNTRAAPD